MQNEPPSEDIEGLGPPLSEMPWSADFVMQAIEILPVALRDGQHLALRPKHADSYIVGWPAGARPEEIAARAIKQLGMEPIILHSTSWRHDGTEVVLSYLAVVSATTEAPPSWEAAPIGHVELARGDATTPPSSIGSLQVLEHALRHLSWLMKDDPVVASAIPEWQEFLDDYTPEPFRSFGPPGF